MVAGLQNRALAMLQEGENEWASSQAIRAAS
jgi:hypothetical protein